MSFQNAQTFCQIMMLFSFILTIVNCLPNVRLNCEI